MIRTLVAHKRACGVCAADVHLRACGTSLKSSYHVNHKKNAPKGGVLFMVEMTGLGRRAATKR